MKRSPRRATDAGSVDSSISRPAAICADCGEVLSDWIIDFDGSTLCLPCADHWEPYHLDEGATA
jgi:formylmethanofuran dehydrogenase subunit E